MIWASWLLVLATTAQGGDPGATGGFHLSSSARERLHTATRRAADWLVEQQETDGSFHSPHGDGVPRLPLTAMALWALSECDRSGEHAAARDAAAAYVLGFQQEDGGIYHPRQGLVRYTSAVARQAIEAWLGRRDDPAGKAALQKLQLFTYRNRSVESFEDEKARTPPGEVVARAAKLLERDDVPPRVDKALRFLAATPEKATGRPAGRGPRPGAVPGGPARLGYEELLRFVSERARKDNETVWRAYAALRECYTLEDNPDLTKRYGPAGFQQRGSGLYYYYLTVARACAAVGRSRLETHSGEVHDWARELGDRLLLLQDHEGFWVNGNGRWWEDDPVLVTSYAVLSLDLLTELRASGK